MTEEIITEKHVEEVTELNTEESKAAESGWRPEGEWTGESESWIDARTFNMRGELLDRIKSQTSQLRGQDKKISKLETGLEKLAEHNRSMDEIAFKKALHELKGLKKDALDVADHDQVVEIDDQISELKATQKDSGPQSQVVEDTHGINPEVTQWIEKNDWYKTDITMRGAADALTMEIVQTYPELKGNPSAVLEKVSNRLKEEFPNKFGKTRRTTTQSVAEPSDADTSTRTKGSGKKYGAKSLNEMQLQIGRTFVEAGAMKNLNEYAEQLAEIGELDAQKGA